MLEASGIPAPIAKAMSDKGYENLTPVQEEVYKDDYSGLDLLVSAQTGSGKTIAFGLAIVENILSDNSFFKTPKSPEALIIVPTRELALQVKNELSWLLASLEAKIVSCVGGMDIRTERRNLETKPNIVVGTPGRLKDHIERNHYQGCDEHSFRLASVCLSSQLSSLSLFTQSWCHAACRSGWPISCYASY